MAEALLAFNNWLNSIVWGPPFMILLVGTGLYLTIRLGFFQFTHLGHAWKQTFGRFFSKAAEEEGGAITSFQAVSSAMAEATAWKEVMAPPSSSAAFEKNRPKVCFQA